MEKDYEKDARIFKAFCDPNRLKILDILDVSQLTLSHHMKILTDSGIVNVRKEGKWSHYSLSEDGIQIAIDYLSQMK